MSKDYAQIANDVVTGVGLLRQSAPDTAKAFSSLSTAATATKALDTKTKELMALAIGIAVSAAPTRDCRRASGRRPPYTEAGLPGLLDWLRELLRHKQPRTSYRGNRSKLLRDLGYKK